MSIIWSQSSELDHLTLFLVIAFNIRSWVLQWVIIWSQSSELEHLTLSLVIAFNNRSSIFYAKEI